MAELTTTQNNSPAPTGVKGLSAFLNSDGIKKKFTEVLGSKANGFIASGLSVINSNDLLQKADANSVYTALLLAASLDLPINPNLGFAYIVPYGGKAQFQLGYKGFKQLAQRSGQFRVLNESDVREGELKTHNRLTGTMEFEWIQNSKERLSKPIIGYVSYFELVNGFFSTFYMTKEEAEAHGKKYSKTYQKHNSGLWKDEFDSMALKTVCKLNLSKNAPLSIEMQRAVVADQAVIKNFDPSSDDTLDIETEYVDNTPDPINPQAIAQKKGRDRVIENINSSTTLEQLKLCKAAIKDDDLDLLIIYDDKKREMEIEAAAKAK